MKYTLPLLLLSWSVLAQTPTSMPLDETPYRPPLLTSPSGEGSEPRSSSLSYQIDATLSSDAKSVSGEVTISFENTSSVALSEILFWQYPNRFSVKPKALSDINQPSYYRGAFSPASMKTSNITVNGKASSATCQSFDDAPNVLCSIALTVPIQPKEEVELSVKFVTEIPKRYGRLGREEGVVMLDGGFYPTLAALSLSGFDTTTPIQSADYRLSLQAPDWQGSSFVNAQGPLESPVSVSLSHESYASWILYPPHHVRQIDVMNDAKTEVLATVSYFYFDSLYRDRVIESGREDAGPPGLDMDVSRDYPSEIVTAAARGVSFFLSLGLTLPSKEVRLIEVPIREYISRAAPGIALVSDRAMKVSPGKNLSKFHTLQILRSMYSALLEQQLQPIEHEEDLQWASDALGAYLSDLYHHEFYDKPRFAKEILKPVSFISEFDRLRWLPQVPFQDAYFKTSYERDLFRDDVRRFPSTWPFGKFIYQKYKALIGEEKFKAFATEYLQAKTPFRELSVKYYGGSLDWFYAQWLREHPKINYKLISLESTPAKEGFENKVVVQREGDSWVKEPVSVFFFFADESFEFKTWPFDTVTYTFSFPSKSRLTVVKIDPSELLHEESDDTAQTAKFDNDSKPTWRPVLDGFYADASSGGINFLTSASTRMANNKRHFYFVGMQLTSGTSASLSDSLSLRVDDFELVSGGYRRGFGASLNEDKLKNTLSTTLALQRFGPKFDADAQAVISPAIISRLSLSWRYNDRQTIYLSWGGVTAETTLAYVVGDALSVSASGFTIEKPCDGGAVCQSLSLTSTFAKLFSLDGGRVFGIRASGAVITGTPFSQDLFDLAGEKNLKGYPQNVIEGRARLFGGIEYRQPLFRGLDVNLFEVDRWRSLSAVVWCNGATISGTEKILQDPTRSLFQEESFFAEAGLGLRFWSDIAGIDPALGSINIVFPLIGSEWSGGPFPPVQFHLGFEENF